MASLKRIVRQNLYTILLLVTAGGFVMIAAELLLTNHTEGLQLVGMVASVVGVILAVAALFMSSRQARNILVILFIVLSISGLMGILQHAGARSGDEDSAAPPLASLSLSGLALLGAVTLLGIPEPQAVETRAAKPAARSAAKPKR